MSDRQPNPDPTCWDCGAPNDPGASECWLCQRRDWRKFRGLRSRLSPPPDLPWRSPLSTIGGWMALIAVIGVSLGLFVTVPGLAIVLLVSGVPALAATELKAFKRRRRGERMSTGERVAWVVAFTILIPILVIVALVVALFIYCSFAMR